MNDQDSIREWLKHVPDRLLNAEAGRRNRWESANSEGIKYAAKRNCRNP
jgi:hypothetical protein